MSSSMPFRIIIVGGGIAGISAAIALRGPNREITILEQSRLNSEIGATISLQPNATRILQESWKLENVREKARGMVDSAFRVYNTEGILVNEIPLLTDKYGADRIMWHRQDLHQYLKQAATSSERPGLPAVVRTSSRVIHCDCDAGTVTLESGEVLHGDIIVGADGIHSKIRTFVLGREVQAHPTGISAYRLMIPSAKLEEKSPGFFAKINPRHACTSMVAAHECRLIMGPARNGDIYSIVGLVPDEQMNEDPNGASSWVTKGDLNKMLKTFEEFPEWARSTFQHSDSIGLWQLRDIDPLDTWTRGRVILIGDAAHAMLPTQGQGASQAVEDAEALGAFFNEINDRPSIEQVSSLLQTVFACRYERASLIQGFSRQAAKPATDEGSKEIKMRPDEFMNYNCMYRGAKEWQRQLEIVV
ncbi:FAD binding domain-containing protein [Periconia macrospinosa]|uniref:FAD binding domain-containing protein n=1 Tax=Periconia macrospinosa TaxID=97972 RepID=A0A2V1DKY3_9PLEO|nr:FAD binding domain-containing protein [Periconia macrospinosa]